jgi:SAM-dependent methyltransferase
MLVDAGVDAWAADQYMSRTYFAHDRVIQDLAATPAGGFDLVIASEVLEHLTDPAAVGRDFRRVLNPAGAVVLTTELYDPAAHGPDWPYLASEYGQHVLFWTRAALRAFADRHGFRSVGYFPDGRFPAVVLAATSAEDLAAALDRAGDRLRNPAEAADAARVWQLFHAVGPHARPLAEAEPAGPAGGGS